MAQQHSSIVSKIGRIGTNAHIPRTETDRSISRRIRR